MEFVRLVRIVIVCLCFGVGMSCANAESSDPYLQELEKEAQLLELIKNAEQLDSTSNADAPEIIGANATRATLSDGMSQEQFEQILKTHFVGTYMLFDKLSDEQKEDVYTSYQRDGQIMEIRRAIAKHL